MKFKIEELGLVTAANTVEGQTKDSKGNIVDVKAGCIKAAHFIFTFEWDLEISDSKEDQIEKALLSAHMDEVLDETSVINGGSKGKKQAVDVGLGNNSFTKLAKLKNGKNGANYRLIHIDGPGTFTFIEPSKQAADASMEAAIKAYLENSISKQKYAKSDISTKVSVDILKNGNVKYSGPGGGGLRIHQP